MAVLLFILGFTACFGGFLIGRCTKCRWRDALIEWGDRELERQRIFFREQLEKMLNMYDEFYQNHKKAVDEQHAKDCAVFEKSFAEISEMISEMYDAQCRQCFSCHKNERVEDERDGEE